MNPNYYPIIIIILLKISLLLIIIMIIYFLLTYKKPILNNKLWYVYKINNFILNKVLIIIYFSVFIILFGYIRINRMSIIIDLKYFKSYLMNLPLSPLNLIFYLCIYVLIFFIFLLVINKVNQFFIKELKKLHLYSSYKITEDGRATYTHYEVFLKKYTDSVYTHYMIKSTITGKCILFI